MQSMTGFGQAQGDNGRYTVSVSARSVNGRFLDLALRVRDEYRALEPRIRERVGESVARGRVEVQVEIRPLAVSPRVVVREDVIRELHRALRPLAAAGVVSDTFAPGDLLRLSDAVVVERGEDAWSLEDDTLVLDVLGKALDALASARGSEGARLKVALEERLASLRSLASQLDERRQATQRDLLASLRRRLADLLEDRAVDETRLAQEVALLADRSDVTEEIDRLRAHLDHLEEVLAAKGASGKRLDFLVQEVFRELNTLGSKCRAQDVVRLVLDAKVIAEQVREQVQNVE